MPRFVLALMAVAILGMPTMGAIARADDPEAGAWSTVRLNFQRSVAVATVGSKVLLAGVESTGAGANPQPDAVVVQLYDGETGRWATSALSEMRGDFTVTTVGDQALFIGGVGAGGPSTTVDIYNSTTDQWSAGRLSYPSWGGGTVDDPAANRVAVTVGSRVVLLGSYTDTAGRIPDALDVYDSATGDWSTVPLRRLREHPLMVAVGTQVLFVTGTGPDQWTLVDIYDTATGLWTTGNRTQACTPQVATVGTRALLACGRGVNGLADVVDIYDSRTGQWSVGRLSRARTNVTVATVGDQVLFAGGVLSGPPEAGMSELSDAVDIYDAATGRWSTGRLSQPSQGPAVASVGTRVLFASGFVGTDPAVPPPSRGPGTDPPIVALYSDAVDIYDSQTGHWSRTTLGRGRGHIIAATVGDRVLFAGGSISHGGRYNDERFDRVDIYDAVTGQWSSATLSYPRVPLAAAVVADKALFIGHRLTCGYCTPGPSDVVVDIFDAAIPG